MKLTHNTGQIDGLLVQTCSLPVVSGLIRAAVVKFGALLAAVGRLRSTSLTFDHQTSNVALISFVIPSN